MNDWVAYTFVCLTDNSVAAFVDIQALSDGGYRAHSQALLRGQASAASVEVWRDEAACEVIFRDGVRSIAPRATADIDALGAELAAPVTLGGD